MIKKFPGNGCDVGDFITDAVQFCRMFYLCDTFCDNHGLDLQREMVKKYPVEWMHWLLSAVGIFIDHKVLTFRPDSVCRVLDYKEYLVMKSAIEND